MHTRTTSTSILISTRLKDTHVSLHICTSMHARTRTHTSTHARTHEHTHTNTHTHTHTHTHNTHTHTHTHTHIHTRTHARTHAHKHTHTHKHTTHTQAHKHVRTHVPLTTHACAREQTHSNSGLPNRLWTLLLKLNTALDVPVLWHTHVAAALGKFLCSSIIWKMSGSVLLRSNNNCITEFRQ